jgi:hypothetical protein
MCVNKEHITHSTFNIITKSLPNDTKIMPPIPPKTPASIPQNANSAFMFDQIKKHGSSMASTVTKTANMVIPLAQGCHWMMGSNNKQKATDAEIQRLTLQQLQRAEKEVTSEKETAVAIYLTPQRAGSHRTWSPFISVPAANKRPIEVYLEDDGDSDGTDSDDDDDADDRGRPRKRPHYEPKTSEPSSSPPGSIASSPCKRPWGEPQAQRPGAPDTPEDLVTPESTPRRRRPASGLSSKNSGRSPRVIIRF